MINNQKKIIVIGSGFGGMAAALRLRAKKYQVTLIEKHKDLGGRARVFKKNGFTFDGGPTVITAPYLINELFELYNKNPKNYIKLVPLDTWYQFIFDNGLTFDYSGNEDKMKKQIQKINKEGSCLNIKLGLLNGTSDSSRNPFSNIFFVNFKSS